MAIQETTPPHSVLIGYRKLAVLAVIVLLIVVAIFGTTMWAISRTFAPLREGIRALSRRMDAGFAGVRKELLALRKDIGDLDNQATRIETILEQQRQGTMAPDTP